MKTRLAVACAVILPLMLFYGDPRATPWWGTFLIALAGFGLGHVAEYALYGHGEKRRAADPALVAMVIVGALLASTGAVYGLAFLTRPRQVSTQPPAARPAGAPAPEVEITIRADGSLELAGAQLTDAALATELARHPSDAPFVVKTSDGVPYKRIVEVLDLFARSGHSSVSLK
jgi:biopolymer transport protein ExbD